MDYINELLGELRARLPELEWKVSGFTTFLPAQSIPKGLFRSSVELTGIACINEIKADIHTLSQQDNERSARYLAQRIQQKITVLVSLCQRESRKKKSEEKPSFGMNMLATRQQWIATIEKDIHALEQQQKAITKAIGQMHQGEKPEAILSAQGELGAVERRLTLAKEALNQALM